MAIPLGIEAFLRTLPSVLARVFPVVGGAPQVRGGMLDCVLANDGAGHLRRNAGRFIATLSRVVAQLGGMVSPVRSAVPLPRSVVPSIGSSVTLVGQTIPTTACTLARGVVVIEVGFTRHGAVPHTRHHDSRQLIT